MVVIVTAIAIADFTTSVVIVVVTAAATASAIVFGIMLGFFAGSIEFILLHKKLFFKVIWLL